jgi:hypothetical protein
MTVESKGVLTISVSETKKVADAVVVISVPCNADWLLFNYASNGSIPAGYMPDEEYIASTVLAWTHAQCCDYMLRGNPLSVLKTRVSNVKSNVGNGCLNICFNTQGNLTYVKKSISVALKCLVANVYSVFDKNIKALNLKSSREDFEKVAKEFHSALGSKCHITVVGRVNLNRTVDGKTIPANTTLKDVREKLENLIDKSKAQNKPAKTHVPTIYRDAVNVVKASGVNSFILQSYIHDIGGLPSEIINGNIHITNKNWDTIRTKLADKKRVEAYVDKKYGHKSLEDHLNVVLAYQIACSTDADAHTVQSVASKKVNTDVLSKTALASLK